MIDEGTGRTTDPPLYNLWAGQWIFSTKLQPMYSELFIVLAPVPLNSESIPYCHHIAILSSVSI